MVCFLRPMDKLAFDGFLPVMVNPIPGIFLSWPPWCQQGELDPLEAHNISCTVKPTASQVLGPRLENWGPRLPMNICSSWVPTPGDMCAA